MTEKEKAQEIFDKMMQTISDDCEHSGYCTKMECNWKGMTVCKVNINEAKQCALICVEEIIEQWEYIDTYLADKKGELNPNLKFWLKVKEEIKKQ